MVAVTLNTPTPQAGQVPPRRGQATLPACAGPPVGGSSEEMGLKPERSCRSPERLRCPAGTVWWPKALHWAKHPRPLECSYNFHPCRVTHRWPLPGPGWEAVGRVGVSREDFGEGWADGCCASGVQARGGRAREGSPPAGADSTRLHTRRGTEHFHFLLKLLFCPLNMSLPCFLSIPCHPSRPTTQRPPHTAQDHAPTPAAPAPLSSWCSPQASERKLPSKTLSVHPASQG